MELRHLYRSTENEVDGRSRFQRLGAIREVTRQFQPSVNEVIQSIVVRFTVAPP